MRGLCATGLIMLLCAHPLLADGPLARSISREASRVAGQTSATPEPAGWKHVRALQPGRKVIVTTGEGLTAGAFVEAGASTLSIAAGGLTKILDAGDVQLVTGISRRGSAGAAAAGAVGGLFAAPIVVLAIAGESRAAYLAAWAALIGLPIAGGYGAWYGTSRMAEEVIFRRASPAQP
jgi:hypothetical protein